MYRNVSQNYMKCVEWKNYPQKHNTKRSQWAKEKQSRVNEWFKKIFSDHKIIHLKNAFSSGKAYELNEMASKSGPSKTSHAHWKLKLNWSWSINCYFWTSLMENVVFNEVNASNNFGLKRSKRVLHYSFSIHFLHIEWFHIYFLCLIEKNKPLFKMI